MSVPYLQFIQKNQYYLIKKNLFLNLQVLKQTKNINLHMIRIITK